VPQTLDVLPGYTVEDFTLLGRYARLTGWRLFGALDHEIVRAALRQVDALQFAGRQMDELSGGERQRALIARALAQETPLILLDEPTSALDLRHQMVVCQLIHELNRAGKTIVMVTHDLNLASQFASRLVLLQRGRIACDGAPHEVLRPEILEPVYETALAFGEMPESSARPGARPWVLPRA